MYNMPKESRHIELAGTAVVGPKGQVVIPSDVRRNMNIVPGDKLIVLYIPDKKSVGFVSESNMQEIINKMGANLDSLKTIISNQ